MAYKKQGIYFAKIIIYEYSFFSKKYDLTKTTATLTSASLKKLNAAIKKYSKGKFRTKVLQRGFQPGVQWEYGDI